MVRRRQSNPIILALLALVLILPPLTSAVADGLGIDIAHHHCETEHDADTDLHDGAEADPYQCDQCHVALAALPTYVLANFGSKSLAPEIHPIVELLSVRAPPIFKPPIV